MTYVRPLKTLPYLMPSINITKLNELFSREFFKCVFIYNPDAITRLLQDLSINPDLYNVFKEQYASGQLCTASGVGYELLI